MWQNNPKIFQNPRVFHQYICTKKTILNKKQFTVKVQVQNHINKLVKLGGPEELNAVKKRSTKTTSNVSSNLIDLV